MAVSIGQKKAVAIKVYDEIIEHIEKENQNYFQSKQYTEDLSLFLISDKEAIITQSYYDLLSTLPEEILSIKVQRPEEFVSKWNLYWTFEREDDIAEKMKDLFRRKIHITTTYRKPGSSDDVYYAIEYQSLKNNNISEIEKIVKDAYKTKEGFNVCLP